MPLMIEEKALSRLSSLQVLLKIFTHQCLRVNLEVQVFQSWTENFH